MTSKYQVTRNYQLGGESTFGCSTLRGLLRAINQDAREMRETGDCQGLGYTMDESAARALGLYEVSGGGWVIPGTEILVTVE